MARPTPGTNILGDDFGTTSDRLMGPPGTITGQDMTNTQWTPPQHVHSRHCWHHAVLYCSQCNVAYCNDCGQEFRPSGIINYRDLVGHSGGTVTTSGLAHSHV